MSVTLAAPFYTSGGLVDPNVSRWVNQSTAVANFPEYIDPNVPSSRKACDGETQAHFLDKSVTSSVEETSLLNTIHSYGSSILNIGSSAAGSFDQAFSFPVAEARTWDPKEASSPEIAEKMKASNELGELIKNLDDFEQQMSEGSSILKQGLDKLDEIKQVMGEISQILHQMSELSQAKLNSQSKVALNKKNQVAEEL